METVFITGVAGFIGSSLAEKIVDSYHLIGIDDFNNYYSPVVKTNNVKSLRKKPNFKLYKGDICNEKLVHKIFSEQKIDKIVHLAARAGVRPSLQNPKLYITVNIEGTNNILQEAKNFKIKQFVFGSSSSVYGNNTKVPFSETDTTDHPISPYAVTKIAGEKLCYSYHHNYQIPMTVFRFFSVYGPKGRPDMAPYIFTRKILNGAVIEVYGDGSQARDFTYIDDIVEGIICALKKPFNFEIINLGNSYPISVKELVKTIEKTIGKKAKIKHLKKRLGDVEKTYADISKAKNLLNWQPHTSISEGLKKFTSWYKTHNL